ncbi:CheR family methyltransferase [Maribellus maritimus]|uniref:CheR family methyltransferase n=1 Tax=Maribellus maritimus TaxID=2870838 RepID=UPI001EECA0E2|nr:protein-glutamate O-methyltransferase CheR [Maribellus maritimus]MCG6187230.1 protein-glutamate O-methyltransferase CheR [Maribellus maritimus]
MDKQKIYEIVYFLKSTKGIDFSGYRLQILERRIQKRFYYTNTENFNEYYEYLRNSPAELNNLFDVLALNVSHFFRNALTFELLRKKIIPEILNKKKIQNENNIRIWSAGCANGDEPYSVAIICKEFLDRKENNFQINLFATDFDEKSLNKGRKGIYKASSLRNIKYGILNKYFVAEDDNFILSDEIKKMVRFSFFDLVNKHSRFPSESIYGGFDIVFCRNVLIYYDIEIQKLIFDRLYNSLNQNGYLILGEAETIIKDYKYSFRRENNYCKIYVKSD